ncbi:MAG: beta-L-arabinofuranosidase domain-containing protein [Anaerolineales bacterium]|jgi:DUF1680 family protein
MEEFSARQVAIHDPFWSPRQETNAQRAIFHQWEQLEASGCIDNFRIAAGEKDGFREGWFFADSDAYKWLDAAARIYALHPDPELGARMAAFLALLQRAQTPDGYLFTYNQIHFPGMRWVNLQIEHELYCHGHLIEACISHHAATDQIVSMTLARGAADLLVRDFLGKGPERTPGHEEIEIALLRLYQVTGHVHYLDLARHFLEQRGRTRYFAVSLFRQNASVGKRGEIVRKERLAYLALHPEHAAFKLPAGNTARSSPLVTLRYFASALSGKFFQQHRPIRMQNVPVGHSVRFGYLETATALLHRLSPDPSLLPVLEQAWDHMVARRMYVTGGLGSLPDLEGFGNDYELDPEFAYAETCAALAGMFWNWEMALITGKARYSDLFEWQLYNAAAVGMGLDGESYLYNNPLACRGGITRQAWYDVPCCPSNLSRTWADLGRYIYSQENDELWIHQYVGSRVTLKPNVPMEIELHSELPYSGRVSVRLDPQTQAEFTLHLRLPAWSVAPQIMVNGNPVELPAAAAVPHLAAGGYDPRPGRFLPIRRTWSAGDTVEIAFDMPVELRRAHPKVRGHHGKIAVTRGPLVYCLESVDNPGVDLFTCRLVPASLMVESAPALMGGIQVLRGATVDGRPLTFIPYALWANRGKSQMNVWINT